MKELDFQDYTATVTDDDGDDHDSTVRAAVVGEDHVYLKDQNGNNVRREVMTPTGSRQVSKGDVFVETERPGVYDYLTADAWASTGYGGAADDDDAPKSAAAKKAAAKRALPDGSGS